MVKLPKISRRFLAASFAASMVTGSILPGVANAQEPTDIEAGKWYSDSVNTLVNDSILNGYTDGLFHPNDGMTRAQAVKVIAVAKGLDLENIEAPGFSDVTEGDWYYKYITAAKNAGIVLGNGTDEFKPEEVISRSEMASLLVKAYHLTGTASVSFTDVTSEDWFYDEVQALVANNVTLGTSATTFSPKGKLIRASGAEFVYRAKSFTEAPVAGEVTIGLLEGNTVTADYAGANNVAVELPLDSTLTSLSLDVSDYNLNKEDVLVQLTGVPEAYPAEAPAVPNTWGTLAFNETNQAWELVVPETNNPYSFNLAGNYTLEAVFVDASGNGLPLTVNVTVADQTAPEAGVFNLTLSDGTVIPGDFGGTDAAAITVPLNSTLTALSLNVTDINLVKDNVTVQLTAVPEGYPADAPAVPNTWGTLVFNETNQAWELVVPETNNPYSFNLAGDHTLEATFTDVAGNEASLTIVTTVE